jgi:hypothetical protein
MALTCWARRGDVMCFLLDMNKYVTSLGEVKYSCYFIYFMYITVIMMDSIALA